MKCNDFSSLLIKSISISCQFHFNFLCVSADFDAAIGWVALQEQ